MRSLNKCIGIISYLPNDNTRSIREKALDRTLETCSRLFKDIDIIIITQNWNGYSPKSDNKLIIYKYPSGLGIMGARKKLREVFIQSNYEYLIMMDDDANIMGDSSELYLNQIDDHPDMAGWFTYNLLTLFAISKTLFKKINYPNVRTEDGFFDDEFIYGVIENKYKDSFFHFKDTGLSEKTLGQPGIPSTWWNNKYRVKDIQERTRRLVQEYVKNN